MPRLVYGLLRSPVLTQAPGHHPDLHTALRLLWTALPPEELRRAVYPLLSSFTTPDVQVRLGGPHARAWFLAVKQGNCQCRHAQDCPHGRIRDFMPRKDNSDADHAGCSVCRRSRGIR